MLWHSAQSLEGHLGICFGQPWDFLRRPEDARIPDITQRQGRGVDWAAEIIAKSLVDFPHPRYGDKVWVMPTSLSLAPTSLLNLRSWYPMYSQTPPPGSSTYWLPYCHWPQCFSKLCPLSWAPISRIALLSPNPSLGLNMDTSLSPPSQTTNSCPLGLRFYHLPQPYPATPGPFRSFPWVPNLNLPF